MRALAFRVSVGPGPPDLHFSGATDEKHTARKLVWWMVMVRVEGLRVEGLGFKGCHRDTLPVKT